MNIAILSDTHGNLAALNSVLSISRGLGVERYYVLGDTLGYYYQAAEAFDELLRLRACMIAGNHERIHMRYSHDDADFNRAVDARYGLAFDFYRRSFSARLDSCIEALPPHLVESVDDLSIELCHGSPRDPDEYVYPDTGTDALQRLCAGDRDFIFCGHTHYPMSFTCGDTTLINPGSVGQSRVAGGVASWGILNTANRVYTQMSTPYDVVATLSNLDLHGERNGYLRKVLDRNRHSR